MQSRISLCNGAVLRKNLLRFTPLWAAYLALWIIILPLNLLGSLRNSGISGVDAQSIILGGAAVAGNLINLCYAILTAMALFSFLYSSRSVGTLAALPVRRETLFLTNVCTGLLVALVPNLLITLLTWLVGGVTGAAISGAVWQWFCIMALQYLFYFGLASLCACLVGQLLALPVLYGLLNFSAIVLNYLAVNILSTFVYGLSTNGLEGRLVLSSLSPAYHLISTSSAVANTVLQNGQETVVSYSFYGWGYLAILAGVGAAMLLLGFLLFRRRHMEVAGDLMAVRPLRPVFKYCFTVGCSIVLGMLAASTIFSGSGGPGVLGMSACLLLGGFVGYFAAEMLLKKTLHVFGKAWIGFGVFALCLAAAVSLTEFDAFGYERRVPELSELQSVEITQFYGGSGTCVMTDEAHMRDAITLHQRVIGEKKQQEAYGQGDDVYVDTLDLRYTLKNGKVLARSYRISATELDYRDETSLTRQYEAIYNDPALVEQRYAPGGQLTAENLSAATISYTEADGNWTNHVLTSDEGYELYTTCILPDIRDGKLGKADFYPVREGDYLSCDISFDFAKTVRDADGQDHNYGNYINIPITTTATRTLAFLESKGVMISQDDPNARA